MSYTNLQLLRRMVGDPGVPTYEVSSGDGGSKAFYLATPPLSASGAVVTVGGVVKTETTDYTLDRTSGKLVFTGAPEAGTDNIVVDYLAVMTTDADLTEALRIRGLDGTVAADEGPAIALVRAAIDICDWKAVEYSSAADISTDGQSIARGKIADAFANRAKELRANLAAEKVGITTVPINRQDGYNASRDVSSNDVAVSGDNPRRRYYGTPDRLP